MKEENTTLLRTVFFAHDLGFNLIKRLPFESYQIEKKMYLPQDKVRT